MNPENPQRHGPYYKLAFVHRGKPVCRFVRAESVDELQKRLAHYKNFRKIIDELVALSIQHGQLDLFAPQSSPSIKKKLKAPVVKTLPKQKNKTL